MTLIDEILAQAESEAMDRKVQMDRINADRMLMALQKLDSQSEEITRTAEAEIQMIMEWSKVEEARLEKKRSWLSWQLEQYIKSTDEKTIRLPHGEIRLRMGRDKVEVVDLERFIPSGEKYGLMRVYPAYQEPDMKAVNHYVRLTGEIPPGVQLTPATAKFSYHLKGNSNGTERETEA